MTKKRSWSISTTQTTPTEATSVENLPESTTIPEENVSETGETAQNTTVEESSQSTTEIPATQSTETAVN